MTVVSAISWIVLAAVHLAPALALGSARLRRQLYGQDLDGSLAILLAHRSLLFAAVVAASTAAALFPPIRASVAWVVTVSVAGYLAVYVGHGAPRGPLRRIALADVVALPFIGMIWADILLR